MESLRQDGGEAGVLAPATEQVLGQIWAEVLRIDSPGREENFFDLGGHSLLAIRIAARVRAKFGIDIPLSMVLEKPTISEFARVIERAMADPGRETSRAAGEAHSAGLERGNLPISSTRLRESGGRERDRDVYPMSAAQHQLWVIDQLHPDSHTYTVAQAWRLAGALNRSALEWSVNETVKRHEVLRTIFRLVEGEPAQIVLPPSPTPLPVTGLDHLPPPGRQAAYQAFAQQQMERPFDLATGPLIRFHLVRIAEREHFLLLTAHHIVFDEASVGIVIKDIVELYQGYLRGDPAPLPELEFQYRDYALWQHGMRGGGELRTQLDFWAQRLAGASDCELPLDHPHGPDRILPGAIASLVLPLTLVEALQELGRQEGATAFMVLLAAFNVLLHRYTGQEDIVLGLPFSNRHIVGADNLAGLFLNTLVLRTDLSGNPGFRELLRRVRLRTTEAFDHSDVPFEDLVAELNLPPDRNRNPLFQIMVIHQEDSAGEWTLGDMMIRPDDEALTSATKFDLTVYLRGLDNGYRVAIEYSPELMDEETVSRLLRCYRTMLEGIAADADHPIGSIPLLTEAERRMILVDWNDPAIRYPAGQPTFTRMFEAQVERAPEKFAAIFEEERLTYSELNARSNPLAHYLRRKGVGPEVLVGLCLDRSIEMLVGLLGVLKAGGAYLPLDPVYPEDRLAFMIEDSGTRIVLGRQRREWDRLSLSAEWICLDREWPEISSEPTANPAPGAQPEDLAYVIYTSGSTGRPKGVQITHRSLTNLLSSMIVEPGLTAHDTMISVTTISFDIAALELFAPLAIGASVVLLDRESARDGQAISRCLERNRGTVMQATPATWRLLLESGWKGRNGLKILCGGEPLTRELADALLAGSASVWNLYGPTETTIWSTAHRVEQGAGTVPIGRPIANTDVYVLDRFMEPVPAGVVGELWIGGTGLARGYLHRRELTAERFVPHPFRPGARLYRTGDLARFRWDGSLECCGRFDQQVKIRGQRIELGEIETCLRRHPDVRDAAAAVREDGSGEKLLAAYIVPRRGTVKKDDLSRFLGKILPDSMMPDRYVSLPALPQTPNGKLDRKALPPPEPDDGIQPADGVSPRTPTEVELMRLWSEVLNAAPQGIHANFFDLGGHSIHAAKLFARITTTFGVKLSLNSLLQSPTIERLAVEIDTPSTENARHRLAPIQSQGAKPPLFWIPGGRAISVLAFREVSQHLGADQPVYGLESRLPRQGERFADVAERAGQYIALIRSLQPRGPYYLAGFCLGGAVAFEMARQLQEKDEQVAFLALVQAGAPGFPKGKFIRWRMRNQRRLFFLRVLAKFAWIRLAPKPMCPSREERQQILDRLVKLLLGWVGTSSQLPDETQDANMRAFRNYAPRRYDGNVHLFLAQDCYESAGISSALDPRLGWVALTTGKSEIHWVPGDHHSMLSGRHAQNFADDLSTCLSGARQASLPRPVEQSPPKQ